MAANFSANQFEKEFRARSLCNWEVPHWYPDHPRRRTATTKIIANERGHLLPNVERPKSSPWGRFRNTWEMPAIITKAMANEISAPPVGSSRWALPDPNRKFYRDAQTQVKKEPEEIKSEETKTAVKEAPQVELNVPTQKTFSEKEKLNNPLAIAEQGRRSIRHETLERDNDEH